MIAPDYLRRHRRERRVEALALLLRGRELIARPDQFTRKVWARDRWSHPVKLESERAVRFCLAGALARAHYELHGRPALLDVEANTFQPARLDLAAEVLARNAGRMLMPKVGLIIVEDSRLLEIIDARLPNKGSEASFLGLLVFLSDEPRLKHPEFLAAVAAAIAELEQSLMTSRGRGNGR